MDSRVAMGAVSVIEASPLSGVASLYAPRGQEGMGAEEHHFNCSAEELKICPGASGVVAPHSGPSHGSRSVYRAQRVARTDPSFLRVTTRRDALILNAPMLLRHPLCHNYARV